MKLRETLKDFRMIILPPFLLTLFTGIDVMLSILFFHSSTYVDRIRFRRGLLFRLCVSNLVLVVLVLVSVAGLAAPLHTINTIKEENLCWNSVTKVNMFQDGSNSLVH